MSWLHVGLFAGLLAMALPVVLHLLSRGKPRPVVFPALRLIQDGITRQARGFRIRRWLLLFLRMAALALLSLLLAGPGLSRPAPPNGPPGPLEVVLVLDDSASMSARSHDETKWARALRQAEAFVAQLPAGSRAGVITSAGLAWAEGFEECPPGVRAPQPLTPDLNAVQAYLQTLRVQRHGEGLWPAITRAGEWLASRPAAEKSDSLPPAAIVVCSDFYGGVLDGARPTLPPDLHLVWTPCATPGLNPPAITGVQLPSAVLPTSVPLRLSAEVRLPPNYKSVALQWSVDGKKSTSTTVAPVSSAPSPSQGEGRVRVESHNAGHPPVIPPLTLEAGRLEPGLHQVSLQLEPSDAWPAGAQFYGAVEAGSLPVVALVTSDGQPPSSRNLTAFLTALAFAPPSLPAERQHQTLRTLAPADLTAEKLADVQLLVLADLKPLAPRQAQAVEEFVNAGGHVLAIPGPSHTTDTEGIRQNLPSDSADPRSAANQGREVRISESTLAPWSKGSSGGPWHLQVRDFKDPLLKPFAEGQPSLAAPVFSKIYGLSGEITAAPMVLRFDNGQPAMVRTSGPAPRGMITWLAFSPHPDDSNLAQVGAAGTWVVLLDRLAELARPASQRASNVEVGQMVSIPPSLDGRGGGRVEADTSKNSPAPTPTLPSPVQGEGSVPPSLSGRGKGRVEPDTSKNSLSSTPTQPSPWKGEESVPSSPSGGGQGGGPLPPSLEGRGEGRVETPQSPTPLATLILHWPDGSAHPLPPGVNGEASFRVMEPGFYRLDRDKKPAALFAGNIPPAEADFKMLDAPSLLKLYGPQQSQVVTNLAEAKWSNRTTTARKSLAGELALLLLLVLVAESYLANRFYGSREGAEKTPKIQNAETPK